MICFCYIFKNRRWNDNNHNVLKEACCTGCRRRPFTAGAPLIGKINPFSKITVTFEPVKRFGCPSGFRISVKIFWQTINESIDQWMNHRGHSLRLNADVADTASQKSLRHICKYCWLNLNDGKIYIFIHNTFSMLKFTFFLLNSWKMLLAVTKNGQF